MDKKYLILINHVSVYYDDFCALHDVTFDIQKGDFIALMGSNGAGKSTFLNTLMGFLSPKEGTIDFNEEKISLRNPMASIGFSSQKMVMDWYLNVWDNVYLGCSLAGMGGNRAKVLTEKALQRVSLTEKAKKGVDELSGGQQQRVQIGRAIVHEPDLYILDEPTAGLDPDIAENFFAYLWEEHKKGKTIIVSSHDLYLLEKYCNKLLYIEKGNVRYWGGLQEFLQTHHRVALYRGTVKAAKDMPDMTVSYRAFTFLPDESEEPCTFVIALAEGHTLSEALLELSAHCVIQSIGLMEESGLRDFFVNQKKGV